MKFREAKNADIPQIMQVRLAVKENILSNPDSIKEKDYEEFMFKRGKAWVCEIENKIVGFAVTDLQENNIWALFILPEFEGQGIGKTLHDLMLNWYFSQTHETVWLGTSANTRAELFYRKLGWKEVGVHGNGEIKFEMSRIDWLNL